MKESSENTLQQTTDIRKMKGKTSECLWSQINKQTIKISKINQTQGSCYATQNNKQDKKTQYIDRDFETKHRQCVNHNLTNQSYFIERP